MEYNKGVLLATLQMVKPGLARKGIIEQFQHFIFTGTDVLTYNDDICVSHPLETDFKCSVQAEDFFKVINGIKGDKVDIKYEEERLLITSDKTKATLSTMGDGEATSFIEVLDLKGLQEKWQQLPEDFISAAFLCMFSASAAMTHGVLTCIFINDNKIVSSDEIRISLYGLKQGLGAKVLIPARAAVELVKFPIMYYHFNDNWAHFGTSTGVIFSSRVMDGEYPDVEPFFQVEGQKVKLPKELKELVDGVSFMTDGEVELDRKIELKIEEGAISCKAEKDIGWIEKQMDFPFKRSPFSFVINPLFFSQVLTHATTMVVSEDAALFTSGDFHHVISLT